MCDCIKNIEKKIKDQGKMKGRSILSASFINMAFMLNSGEMKPYSEVEIELEGMKQKPKQSVLFTYCPFCAEKYIKE